MKRALVSGIAVLAVTLVAAEFWLARADREAPIADSNVTPTAELVARGEYLARVGNCIACHTAPGQAPFAGGRRIATPFGDVFSSNLTPDAATGLGAWTAADFWRALHYGKSRDGRRLYPAFPYPNYTRVTREDADALFAYLRTLPAAASAQPAATVRFPYDTQLAQRVWRALYFVPGELAPDSARSAEWNRGAYLVEGLGHCNACHTARTWLGGTDDAADYAGGPIPTLGWDALPLGHDEPLSDDAAAEIATLLSAGASARNVMTGPMAEVVFHSLQHLRTDDIAAIVAYLRTLPGRESRSRRIGPRVGDEEREQLVEEGAVVYADRCAECHGDDGLGEPFVYPALAGNRLVTATSANNALQAVLYGGFAPSTAANPRPYGMPPYAHQLSYREVAAVLTYVRASWGNAAPAVSPVAVRER